MQAYKLHMRTPVTSQVYVSGATEVRAHSREEVATVLQRGSAARTTAAHKMNSESSRSHAIITLTLEQHVRRDVADVVPKVRVSQRHGARVRMQGCVPKAPMLPPPLSHAYNDALILALLGASTQGWL